MKALFFCIGFGVGGLSFSRHLTFSFTVIFNIFWLWPCVPLRISLADKDRRTLWFPSWTGHLTDRLESHWGKTNFVSWNEMIGEIPPMIPGHSAAAAHHSLWGWVTSRGQMSHPFGCDNHWGCNFKGWFNCTGHGLETAASLADDLRSPAANIELRLLPAVCKHCLHTERRPSNLLRIWLLTLLCINVLHCLSRGISSPLAAVIRGAWNFHRFFTKLHLLLTKQQKKRAFARNYSFCSGWNYRE